MEFPQIPTSLQPAHRGGFFFGREMTESEREQFEERAAIREYDGEMSREEAEKAAAGDLWMEQAGKSGRCP